MELLVGPTFGMEVAGSGTYVRERTESQTQEKISSSSSSSSSLFLKEDDVGGADQAGDGTGSDLGSPDSSSDSSSSIGAPGDSDDEDEEENGVVSSGGSLGLASMGSVEDSLPIKRGLSNHYAGKSKSFANLSDICSMKDLQKPESPFNKRRRILLAKKWTCRKSSFYTWQNPNSMPLLALNEDNEDGDDDKETSSSSSSSSSPSPLSLSAAASTQKPKLQQSKLKISFKSQSCFSLTDLQVEEEHQ